MSATRFLKAVRALCVAWLVAGIAPAIGAANIEQWQLANGARVNFVQSDALPMVDVQVDFPAGSAYSPGRQAGLAGMVAGLLDAGTARLDENALADRFADLGAQFGASAETDRASVSLRVLSSDIERTSAVSLMAEVMRAPSFPVEVIDRERERAIVGLKEAETQPGYLVERAFMAEIYGTHPYGAAASAESLKAIGRDDLIRFHQRYYVAGVANVSIVGDVDRAEADRMARELTDGLPAGTPSVTLPSPVMPEAKVVRMANPSAQAHIAIGMPGLRRDDPDYYALLTGNYVLGGGGFVSRLMKEVREKRGFAYSIYSHFSPQRVAGPFRIGLQTRGRQVDEAVEVVRGTLADFIANGPTDEELETAKANIVNGFGLRLDSNAKLLGYVSVIGFYDLPLDWLEAYPKAVQALTVGQVRDAFKRRVLPQHLVTVIVGGDGDRAADGDRP